MVISNAEKQARFRKKEELKRIADQVLRESRLVVGLLRAPSLEEASQFLSKAIELPAGWTDEDFDLAVRKIEQYRMDLFSTPDQIGVDIFDSRDVLGVFGTTGDPRKVNEDTKAAIENAHLLAAHLISALRLSKCSDDEQAAALMEAIRLVARSLANQAKVPKSAATTICLATLPSHYERPQWFTDKLVETLIDQLGAELARAVGKRMAQAQDEVLR